MLLALGCLLGGSRAGAQTTNLILGFSVKTNAIAVGSSLTYTLFLTNVNGTTLPGAFVTNVFHGPVKIMGATQTQGTNTQTASSVVFDTGPIAFGFNPTLTLTVTPTNSGFFTNTITLFDPALGTVVGATNLVNLATNFIVRSDLAVALFGPTSPVFSNDWMAYRVSVTNLGPGAVTNVMLTNHIPAGVGLISLSPATTFTGSNSAMIFNLGTLTNGAVRNFTFLVQPTNAGLAVFSASVGATNLVETNVLNNAAATNILVAGYFPASLLAFTNSAQVTNRLTGFIEQKILVTNAGPSAVASVRVVITGLTNVAKTGFTNYLANAWGTNNGNPFVVYASALDTVTNPSVELLLQFYSRTVSHFPFDNSQLHAFAVSRPDLTPPATAGTSTNLHFSRLVPLPPNSYFMEITNTTVGKLYTIVYSSDLTFSNAMIAVPSIVAPANDIQWLDYGPPATLSKPGSGMRFYRVFQNP